MPQIKEPEKPDVVQAVPEMPEKTSEVDYISKMKEFQAINGDHVMVVKSKEEATEPDETEVSFVSVSIEGENLKIEKFNSESGELVLTGTINGMFYFTKKTGKKKKSIVEIFK